MIRSNIDKGIKKHKNKQLALVEYLIKKSNLSVTYSSKGNINYISHLHVDYPSLMMFLGHPYELLGSLVNWCFLNKEKLNRLLTLPDYNADVYPIEIRLSDNISTILPLFVEEGLCQSLFKQYEGICRVTEDLNTTLGSWSSNSEKLLDI